MLLLFLSIVISLLLVVSAIYLVSGKRAEKATAPVIMNVIESEEKIQYRKYNRLGKSDFERIVMKEKAFLNPVFSIKDLTNELNTNHTTLSYFTKNTYGVNFTQLINSLRLKELERIKNLSKNKHKTIKQLVAEAGFGSYRNYLRAKQAGNDVAGDSGV